MCERALKIYEISLVYFVYHYAQFYSKGIVKICGGPLFVGAPGQLPTLPSPKSDPGYDVSHAPTAVHAYARTRTHTHTHTHTRARARARIRS